VHIRSGVQEFAGRREGSYLGASPEVRYILEAVSKPRPARLPPAFLIAPGPASQRPTLLLHLSLSLSLSLSPSSSGTGVRPGARGRDAARGTALNLIWGGLRVRRKVRTHLLTVRSGGGLASPSNWVPVSHALSVRHPLPSPPPLSLSLSLSPCFSPLSHRPLDLERWPLLSPLNWIIRRRTAEDPRVRANRFIRRWPPMSPEMFYAR